MIILTWLLQVFELEPDVHADANSYVAKPGNIVFVVSQAVCLVPLEIRIVIVSALSTNLNPHEEHCRAKDLDKEHDKFESDPNFSVSDPEIRIIQSGLGGVALVVYRKHNSCQICKHFDGVHYAVGEHVLDVCVWRGAQELDNHEEGIQGVGCSQEVDTLIVLLVFISDLSGKSEHNYADNQQCEVEDGKTANQIQSSEWFFQSHLIEDAKINLI